MESVKVAVRMRPMVQSELDKGCQVAVMRIPGEPQLVVGNDPFTFNYVFDDQESQKMLFDNAVLPMLEKFFTGFNVTIFAYGQTGSGKTFTMGTAFTGVLDESAGVIPRVMHAIFGKIHELSDQYTFEITCSFLELYQEQLYDLLSEKSREQSLVEIREDKNGIHIPDLTQEVVNSPLETTDCLIRGSSGRAVASTAMNEHSSRSHAIFTVTMNFVKKEEPHTQTTAKLHLVDLAGSERSKKTQATGERFKEGVKINQGLLALGNVISALGTENGQNFVRYRDSKLTRLLQDSLGGNSCTLMIACISPADYNVQETLSTLRYADRARKIKNKPIVNQDPQAAEINRLKSVIRKLRLELLTANSSSTSSLDTIPSLTAFSPRKTFNDKLYRGLQEKYRSLQNNFQKTLHDVVENEMSALIAEGAHEKLKVRTNEIKDYVKVLALEINDEDQNVSKEKVLRLIEMCRGLDDELENTVNEMNKHKKLTELNTNDDSDNEQLGEEDGAEIEKHADVYNNKQFRFKEELSQLNNQLNIKEQLQQHLAQNLEKFYKLETSDLLKIEEFELKIRDLEKEKIELLDKLKHVKDNASAKLAEDRRKRLQVLEEELNKMKTKIKQQSGLLKVREKEKVKIENLQREIQSMKAAKVKLIRSMRAEADNFRQWKLTREKELLQERNKGRKMENEMAKKEALHTKQRNVLKRKCEEAVAINKRLKDALERQNAAQAQRQKLQTLKDNNAKKTEHVVSIVERELDLIMSIIDAEQSLEYLMEDRTVINRRLSDLRANESPNADEIAQLEEEYEMRNAQISELQQKVCAADLEKRMRVLCHTTQNVSEAQSIFKQLTNAMCEQRRERNNRLNEQKAVLDECRAQLQEAEKNHQTALKCIKLMENEHKENLLAIESQYEEKLALLLNSAEQETVESKICEELFEKVDMMRKQIEYLKIVKEAAELTREAQMNDNVLVQSFSNDLLDEALDMPSRKRGHVKSLTTSENDSISSRFSNVSAESSNVDLRIACDCRTGCQSMCACRLDGSQCSSKCGCKGCTNGRRSTNITFEVSDKDSMLPTASKRPRISSFEIDEAKENRKPTDKANKISQNVNTPAGDFETRAKRISSLTMLSFDTPNAKKKFFE